MTTPALPPATSHQDEITRPGAPFYGRIRCVSNETHIHLLPEQVANKIAAGEVVERPASVVKELVENSIDAGAERIRVEIADGGRKLVSVRDDGSGMGRDDAIMSLERQATSKIRDVGDIERITTLGFRGEAIPSIASVSRFTLTTRLREDGVATRLKVDAGRLVAVETAGAPPGTAVEVRDLFCNVPARRKFLRTAATEEGHVRAAFTVHALAHPKVGFTLVVDGRETYRLAPGATLAERLAELFGPDFAAGMDKIESHEDGPVKVTGFVERQNRSGPSTRRDQFVFVNGRPASAPVVAAALRDAYPRQSGDSRPAAVLFIELPAGDVDVNVHPAKREVRFRRPAEVRKAILEACLPSAPAPAAQSAAPASSPWPQSAPSPFVVPFSSGAPLQLPLPKREEAPPCVVPCEAPAAAGGAPWRRCRFLAITESGYLLVETDAGLVTINPIAALERVAYEALLDRTETVSQPLLIPRTVRMNPIEFARVGEFIEVIRSMGFQIEQFGPDTWKVDAEPQLLGSTDIAAVLASIAADAAESGGKRDGTRWREEAIARSVAKTFAGASPRLSEEGAAKLLEKLSRARQPYVCPRGRPTMIFTSNRELERKFSH